MRRPWVQRSSAGAALLILVVGVTALFAAAAQPASLDEVHPYLRTTRHTNGTIALEVALRRLEPVRGSGPDLWLVAVTHLGTSNYYAQIQQFLDAQPWVLYEAVRHDPDEPPGPREGYSLQADLARVLGLTFQLEAIRYDRPHFQNSDLSFDDLARLFAANTPGAASATADGSAPSPPLGAVEFGALVQAMSGEGWMGAFARLGVALLGASPRLQAATKVAMIEMLGQLPNDLSQIEGLPPGFQRLMRVLIEERNEAVVRDARTILARRPPPAAVAVFYGAGHMADLEYRLCRALGYQPVEDRWLTAFDVDPRASGISQFELDITTRLVRTQLRGLQRRHPDGSTNSPTPSELPAPTAPTVSPAP